MPTINTTSRATAKAGAMQAGDTIADVGLPDLLGFTTTAAGVRVGDLLRERLDAAERAATAHAARFEDAQLRGDDAERAHAEEGARLQREVSRLRLALDRADQRLAEVATAERQAAARAKLKAAKVAADRAEELAAVKIPEAAEALRVLFEELHAVTSAVNDAVAAASAAGIDDEAAALKLPHETRFRRQIVEDREVLVPAARVGVFDAAGRRVDETFLRGEQRFTSTAVAPPEPSMIRRTERVVVQYHHAPKALHRIRVVVPTVDGGEVVVNRGEG